MVEPEIIDDIHHNRHQPLEFVTSHTRWVKVTPNEVWSGQQKVLIESVLKPSDRIGREGITVRSSGD